MGFVVRLQHLVLDLELNVMLVLMTSTNVDAKDQLIHSLSLPFIRWFIHRFTLPQKTL